jgi:hypothetical protein
MVCGAPYVDMRGVPCLPDLDEKPPGPSVYREEPIFEED